MVGCGKHPPDELYCHSHRLTTVSDPCERIMNITDYRTKPEHTPNISRTRGEHRQNKARTYGEQKPKNPHALGPDASCVKLQSMVGPFSMAGEMPILAEDSPRMGQRLREKRRF